MNRSLKGYLLYERYKCPAWTIYIIFVTTKEVTGYPHFTDAETGAQKGYTCAEGNTVSRGNMDPVYTFLTMIL